MAPNTITPPNGGPLVEFPEVMFGADLHCGVYDPVAFGAGAPAFGWGPRCPNNQSGVANNFAFPVHGTWPVPNRVLRNGAFKAPSLRNVELTGPYFHTGSYLTLRQVVDFYLQGGDFPVTNTDNRDPHLMNIDRQAFGFGPTILALMGDVDPGGTVVNGFLLQGTFGDALPDTQYQYGFFPDTIMRSRRSVYGRVWPGRCEERPGEVLDGLTDPVKFGGRPSTGRIFVAHRRHSSG
jgi:hypothetical protein